MGADRWGMIDRSDRQIYEYELGTDKWKSGGVKNSTFSIKEIIYLTNIMIVKHFAYRIILIDGIRFKEQR